MPLLLRQDNFTATKRPNCNTGEPCGGSCIDPREQCNAELSPQMKAQVEGLKNSLLNTIPGYAQINSARAVVNDFKRVRQAGDRGQQAMYLGALLVGTSLLAYTKYREKYREGFANSAEVALRRSKGMASSVPDIGGKQNVIFAVDSSLSKGDKGRGGGLADELMKDAGFAAKYHVTSIKQNAHDNPKDMDLLSPRDRKIAEAMVPIKQALMNARNGQSDAAVELASQILAYNDKHGKKIETYKETVREYGTDVTKTKTREVPTGFQMNIIGHGDGGMVVSEAMEILKRVPGATELANRINVIGLNTPDGGLTDAVGKVRTIASRSSPVSLLPMKNKVTMDAPDGEGGRAMLRKKAVREFIDGHFGGSPADVPKPKAEAPTPDAPKSPTPPAANNQQSLNLQPPTPKAPTPTQSTFSQSSGVAKTSTFSAGDDSERIAESRTRMVGFANALQTKGASDQRIEELKTQFPGISEKEVNQAKLVYKAPNSIKQMLRSGNIQPGPAAKIAALMSQPKDRGDFEDLLADEEQTRSLDLNKPQDVDYLVEQFKSYKTKMRGDSTSWGPQVAALNKRLDALSLRVG